MDGTDFGRYRLLELLGRGGMGEVWRARDTATARIVAVKVLLPHFAADDIFQQRFRREAHAAAGLNEPHVVPIHDYGEIDGRLFVDMRLIEGDDLQALLRTGPLTPARAVYIVEQVAMAVEAAHDVGLVHRDIKPSNILVAKFDFAYLIDFGIAHMTGESGLTGTGSTVGTWHYMAPERFTTGNADGRADVYALTCVLHECLTGARPFPGDSAEQQIAGHLMTPPPRPSASVQGVPTGLDGVIAKGMAKDPTDRYQSAMDLAHAARAAMDAPTNPNVPWVPEQTATQMAPTTPIVPRVPVANPSVTWPHSSATQAAPLISATPVSPPSYGQPPTGPAPTNNRRKWIIGGAAAAVLVVAIAAVIAIVGSRPDTSSTSATASSEATPSAAAEEVTSTEPTADPWPASDTGTKETIADYVAKNGITETAVKQGDPGAPKIDLPVPPGWKPAGAQTPEWAYSAIMYTGAESAKYQPTIIALMSKLTGNVDPKKILSLAPGELQNLPGWKGTNSGTASSLDGNDAFQAGGTWVDKGVTKAVAQKTVVIPRSDGLYVLQLNVDGLPSQQNILDTATTAIDDQTKIT